MASWLAFQQRWLDDITEIQSNKHANIQLRVHTGGSPSACLVLKPENSKPLHLTVDLGPDWPHKQPYITIRSNADWYPTVTGDNVSPTILAEFEWPYTAHSIKGVAIILLGYFGQDHSHRARAQYVDDYRCDKCMFGNYAGLPHELLLPTLEDLEESDKFTMLVRQSPSLRPVVEHQLWKRKVLRCSVLRQDYRKGAIASDFGLISRQAIDDPASTQPYDAWLPLPISVGHWRRVEHLVPLSLDDIAQRASVDRGMILHGLMIDLIRSLNNNLDPLEDPDPGMRPDPAGLPVPLRIKDSSISRESAIHHALEKVLESYFYLFHLLVCFAASEGGSILVQQANHVIKTFKQDRRSLLNMDYLHVALLISDEEVTQDLMGKFVAETITRNVPLLLDPKGAGMAELAYLEAEPVSRYRLQKTFEGSKNSYRYLLLADLFRRAARPNAAPPLRAPDGPHGPSPEELFVCGGPTYSTTESSGGSKKTLAQIRAELFDNYGAPPSGTAGDLVSQIQHIKLIDNFEDFSQQLGFRPIPTAEQFTDFLRFSVRQSHALGYSKEALSQADALKLRYRRDKSLDWSRNCLNSQTQLIIPDTCLAILGALQSGRLSFLPDVHKPGDAKRT
ncbi:hypothetical protein GE09DRAFT_1272663 [Coniochaeta sp. 2T2.1]|nr:hypothetical protein GE09DRAFT_1272663 [Coniochaeta sp. 2T2.1]